MTTEAFIPSKYQKIENTTWTDFYFTTFFVESYPNSESKSDSKFKVY